MWWIVGIGSVASASTVVADTFTVVDGLPQVAAHDAAQDRDGWLWVATSGGVAKFDGSRFEPVRVLDLTGRPVLRFHEVEYGPDERLWLSSPRDGLFRTDEAGIPHMVENQGWGEVLDLQSHGGRLWIQGRAGDWSCVDDTSCRPEPRWSVPEPGFSNWTVSGDRVDFRDGSSWLGTDVIDFFEDRAGRGWVSTASGLIRLVARPFQVWPVPDYGGAFGVQVVDDELWVRSTSESVFRFDPVAKEPFEELFGGVRVRQLLTHGYALTESGVLRQTDTGVSDHPSPEGWPADGVLLENGIPTGWLRLMPGDRRFLWNDHNIPVPDDLLTYDRMAMIEPVGERVLFWGAFGAWWLDEEDHWRPMLLDGIPLPAVRSLARKEGDLWLATYGGGLYRWRLDSLEQMTTAEGLCDDALSRVAWVGDSLWLNGNRGAFSVEPAAFDRASKGAEPLGCKRVGTPEGNGRGVGSITHVDGGLWFPSVNGVVRVEPVPEMDVEVPTLFVDASSGRQSLSGEEVTVTYRALALGATAPVEYRHRIQGVDEEWRLSDGPRGTWSRLPPGNYILDVQAGVDGVWSDVTSHSIQVTPRWYERNDARLGLLSLLMAGGLLFNFVMTQRTRERTSRRQARRRRVEESMARRERSLQALFESTTNGLFILDRAGRLLQMNPAAEQLLEGTGGPWMGGRPNRWVIPDHAKIVDAMVTAALGGRTAQQQEVRLVNGATLLIAARQIVFEDADRILLTATDITAERLAAKERATLREQLHRSQNLEAVGGLAGGIAHDFNNLLAVILGQVELMQMLDPSTQTYAEPIASAAERGAALTRKLLVFSRSGPLEKRVVRTEDVVDGLLGLLRRTIREDIRLRFRGRSIPIEIDPGDLEQSLINLVVNARDAIDGAGQITIEVGQTAVAADRARQHHVEPGRYATIEVRDSGQGISPEDIERIFDPFFTTKDGAGGTGLGLSTVAAAVRRAGGFIEVSTAPGVGSAFLLLFPATQVAMTEEPERKSTAELTGLRLVLCDDDDRVRRVVATLLRGLGCEVVAVGTAEEVLAVIRSDVAIDILVTDVVMPLMGGPELAQNALDVRPDLKVLFITGYAPDLEPGPGQAMLAKPFGLQQLADHLLDLTS